MPTTRATLPRSAAAWVASDGPSSSPEHLYAFSPSPQTLTSLDTLMLGFDPTMTAIDTSSSSGPPVAQQTLDHDPISQGSRSLPSPSELMSTSSAHHHLITPSQGQGAPDVEPQNQFASSSNAGSHESSVPSNAFTARKTKTQWSNHEDSLLRACVQREGTKWPAVLKRFISCGGNVRTVRAVEHRWQDLSLRDRKQQLASTNSAVGGGGGGGGSTSTRTATFGMPWSQEEKQVLRRSISRHHQDPNQIADYTAVHADFFAAFPETSRSCGSVRSQVRKLAGLDRRGAGGVRGGEVGGSAVASESLLRISEGEVACKEAQGSTSQHIGRCEAPSRITSPNPSPAISPAGATSPHLHPLARSPDETVAARQNENSPGVSINIVHHANGVCIEGNARGHHVVVYSPNLVTLTRQPPGPTMTSFGQTYEPAFHVSVLEDGSIIPLRLPEGTAASMTLVKMDEGQALDTRFEGADGYTVLLRSIA